MQILYFFLISTIAPNALILLLFTKIVCVAESNPTQSVLWKFNMLCFDGWTVCAFCQNKVKPTLDKVKILTTGIFSQPCPNSSAHGIKMSKTLASAVPKSAANPVLQWSWLSGLMLQSDLQSVAKLSPSRRISALLCNSLKRDRWHWT